MMPATDLAFLIWATHGECDGGDCRRRAVSFAFDKHAGLIPVCRRHITVYRILGDRRLHARIRSAGLPVWLARLVLIVVRMLDGSRWQAEDEYAGLRFCRRARFRWLAQRRLLADQLEALAGRTSAWQAERTRVAESGDSR